MAAPTAAELRRDSSSTPRSRSSTTARSARAHGRSSSATRPGSASSSCEPIDFFGRRAPALLADARAALADYLGCAATDLAFVQNATTGVNLAARSLDLGPGDEVLATDLEYGACDLAWEWVCDRTGARYVRAAIPLPLDDPRTLVDALFAAASERTRVLYVSHITSETGLLLPLEEILARARELGLVAIVDGAHALAQVPVNLDRLGADFYAGNAHKWLCAPKGAGFLHVRPEHQERVDGADRRAGGTCDRRDLHLDRIERQGTRDPAA